VPGSPRLVDLVHDCLVGFLDEQDSALRRVSPELAELTTAAREFLAGGKRLRARFCYWGWAAVAMRTDSLDPTDESAVHDRLDAVVAAAAALELFHAAALAHDDIMDNSDLRRGKPSLHRRFEAFHTESGWSGDAAGYGRAAALLLGDLLLGWSDDLFERGLTALPASAAAAARAEFATMRSEVTLGQYLDMLDEVSWRDHDDLESLERAHRVVVYKSAKYSVEAPLALGAALAEGSLAQVSALRDFGLPLGVAFQLRDDILGVFGDEAKTGKPAGDDLREGKRTMLIALTRKQLPSSTLRIFDELVGDADLDPDQIAMLQTAVRDSGAVDHVERMIAREVGDALAALDDAPLARGARDELRQLAVAATDRVS